VERASTPLRLEGSGLASWYGVEMLGRVRLVLAGVASLTACGQAHTGTTPARVVAHRSAPEAPATAESPAKHGRRLATTTFSTCAVRDDRRVVCWGDNGEGELGGGDAELHGPREVPGVNDVVEIAGGGGAQSYCARREDGEVWCWGHGYGAPTRVPVHVKEPTQIAAQTWGCAVGAAGDASCWRGATTQPETVPLEGVSHVAVRFETAVWWTPADGALFLWRGGSDPAKLLGQLHEVVALESQNSTRFVCALTAAGEVLCTDLDDPEEGPQSPTERLPPARDLALGVGWSCALARDEYGSIHCWDDEGGRKPRCNELFDRQICTGPGPTPQAGLEHATPTFATHIADAVEIIGGGYHLCGRTRSGAVFCWGDNNLGCSDPSADAPTWLPEPKQILSLADKTH
jgi:hypothetical protein